MATINTDRKQDLPIILVSSTTAAEMLGISSGTLANWRCLGKGPAYVRLGERHSPILYRVSDIEAWLDSRVVGA